MNSLKVACSQICLKLYLKTRKNILMKKFKVCLFRLNYHALKQGKSPDLNSFNILNERRVDILSTLIKFRPNKPPFASQSS